MLRRVLPTIATACVLYGAYSLYALFLTPLFSPQMTGPPRRGLPNIPGLRQNVEQARRFLADEAWAADAKYKVRQDDAYMYAEEWEKVESTGEVRFTPFAMIWHRDGEEPGKAPIVIRSDAARLRFEEPFDETDPRPGRVVGGALEGNVQIRGDGGLKITTRNVQFAETSQRLWSDHPVTFAFGPHSGQALGLELDLIPAPHEEDKPAIGGVRTLRLRRDVQMTLVQPPENGQPGETIHVRSEGMFEYHLEQRQAAFQKNVHVEHPTGPHEADTLDANLLTLFLEPPEGAADPQKPRDASRIEDQLELRKLRAEGTPAVLISQRGQLEARPTVMTYDVKTRTAQLTHPDGVRATQKTTELRCADLTITHTEDGEIATAIGRGAGQLVSLEEQSAGKRKLAVAFTAEWGTDLTLEPDAEQLVNGVPLDRVTLRGNAVVRQTGQVMLRGDVLQVWVSERPEEPSSIPGSARRSTPRAGDLPTKRVKPQRMLATGSVQFEGRDLSGTTNRLDAKFEDGRLPLVRPTAALLTPGAVESRDRGSAALQLRPHVNRTGFAYIESERPGPVRQASAARNAPPKKLDKLRSPAHIVADAIRLRVVQDGEQADVAEVWTDGHVTVTQQRGPGEPPFELRGEHLHLLKYSEVDQVVHLTSGADPLVAISKEPAAANTAAPATIKDRGFEIEGHSIHLDRGKNFAMVSGPGRLRLPIRNSPDGKPLAAPMPLDVFWTEEMSFNGHEARFLAGVRTTMGEHRLQCEQMQVRLVRPVQFAATSVDSQKAEVSTVHCEENVEVESREHDKGQLVSLRKARAWDFELDQTTGNTVAKAPPGSLVVWNRGSARRAGKGAAAGVQANQPQRTDASEWEYTRIDFAGEMRGNLRNRSSTFQDRVLVVYGPVAQPGDVVDPDALPQDGGWMRSDSLKVTQHEATPQQPAWVEMLATGNALLHGRPVRTSPLTEFHVLADSISFDESKGLYLIRSVGNRTATIWRQVKAGKRADPVTPQRAEFIPARNILKLERVSGLDVLQ